MGRGERNEVGKQVKEIYIYIKKETECTQKGKRRKKRRCEKINKRKWKGKTQT